MNALAKRVIGRDVARLDGPAKTRGAAMYAGDFAAPGMLYGCFVTAPVPAGRVVSVDASAALEAPGVVRVLTAADLPRFADAPSPPRASKFWPMQGDEVRHEGQPVAIVLAETREAAEDAASRLVAVRYERAPHRAVGEVPPEAPDPKTGYLIGEADFTKGDPGAGLAGAARRVEATYTMPSRHHNAMEPSSTLAEWGPDGSLVLHDSVQHGGSAAMVAAAALGVDAAKVRVVCPHTGGGFGHKGYVWPHQVLCAAAARAAGRPVLLTLTRAQMYGMVGYQPRMVQRVALGAGEDGRLAAVVHESSNVTGASDDFTEMATVASRGLYATPALRLAQRVERAHVALPTAMRAPVDGPGTWALGSAMNELAHALGMDPLELRLRNHADADPVEGKPWSSKRLKEAYDAGAAMFDWRGTPRACREGDWVLATGMADCTMGTFRFPSSVRVALRADGTALLEGSFNDIGSGTVTIFPQIAAAALGIEPSRVGLRHGDTALPAAGPTYGSSSTIGVGGAVLDACRKVVERLARAANLPPAEAELRDGRVARAGGPADGGVPVADAMRAAGLSEVAEEGGFALPGGAPFEADGGLTPFAMRTWGAVFVEVAVDAELGLLRLRRAVGSYSVGSVVNPRTARAQMVGGIVWGWGQAAMERSVHEPRLGRFLSKNLSGVAVPVNADIPSDIRVHFVDEFDGYAGPLGAKGIGELGATGVSAAVADAVFHAIGKRVRSLPILPADLVAAA